jgi:hypothetical protein
MHIETNNRPHSILKTTRRDGLKIRTQQAENVTDLTQKPIK